MYSYGHPFVFERSGVSVGQAIDKSNNKSRMRVWLVLILLPLSMEGVTEELSFNRHETVTISRVVPCLQSRSSKNWPACRIYPKPCLCSCNWVSPPHRTTPERV